MNFITKYFSSIWSMLTAPFRVVWHVITVLFPPKDCSIMNTHNGTVKTYQQGSFLRFTKFCVVIAMILWASWSSYVYVYHRPLLQKRTQQLEDMKNLHNRQITDLKQYLKKYNDLTHSLNVADNKILNAEKDKISAEEKEKLIASKLKTWGELDFLYTRISEMMGSEHYVPEFEKFADLSLQLELIRLENKNIKEQNIQLQENAIKIADIDKQIVEIVDGLSTEKTEELHGFIKNIDSSLGKLGLSEKILIDQANNYTNKYIIDKFVPLNTKNNQDPRYQQIAQKLEKWSGLNRLHNILPIGAPVKNMRISSDFGTRTDPFTHKTKKHKGIDFAGKIGTELYAVAPGRVIAVGDRAGYGMTVEIDHGLGFTTLYAHLSKAMVVRGDWIKPGVVVGLAGSSGRSTGPHLHYEIRYKGVQFNPKKFVKE
ncbi:MAG: peptidoglycan DD-metalloendopeptidase family protein [Alphaproteobacteria bacterium]|nr:peptidoglycan DD-metalloendopeptidase family protein [Alphaproteobacteria bacterium]